MIEAYSAGTEEYTYPKPLTLEALVDADVNIEYANSKLLDATP